MGLGHGVAGTFNALPEWVRVVKRGRLIRVMPGSHASELMLNPQQGKRRIPAAPAGSGLTVTQLVHRTRKSRGTVRSHLKKLSDKGLAFCDDTGRWWRYRFDPDNVADLLGIPHTSELKAARSIRDRRNYLDGRIAYDGVKGHRPTIERVSDSDGIRYIDTVTGEVLWVDRG